MSKEIECPKCKSTNYIIVDLTPILYECIECGLPFTGESNE